MYSRLLVLLLYAPLALFSFALALEKVPFPLLKMNKRLPWTSRATPAAICHNPHSHKAKVKKCSLIHVVFE
ncbi:hypothetical protein ACSQ67_016037 [Phaseolus vulgaris]